MEPRPSSRLGTFPLLLSLLLAGFGVLPRVRANPILLWSFLITAGFLAAWSAVLLRKWATQDRGPVFSVALLKQHYLQACVHTSILLYWGWYWREVYNHAYLILAQLVFAYAFDSLLQLSRRGRYTLGFGPFPVIFSINLFLWFKDDWFYLQFLLIAAGFLAKELLHWNKDGKSAHIFNPSSFPLAIASWFLLLTHSFGVSFGEAIAVTQFLPPHIYLFMFLVSLPGQFFFGVTTMTLSAVVTMYLWGAAYLALTGTYYFYYAYIPIAVFLAMNLLFTDPSTSPRTELGRILYGIGYAGTVIALEVVTKSFAAKLLLVPLLNLCAQLFDRLARSRALRRFDPGQLLPTLTGGSRNLIFIAIWAVVFGLMSAARGLGDDFPGQYIPFWQTACQNHAADACTRLGEVEMNACQHGSGWACNEVGIEKRAGHDDQQALNVIGRACRVGFETGCANAERMSQGLATEHAAPTSADYPVLLSIFKPSRRPALDALPAGELNALACRRGWTDACRVQ